MADLQALMSDLEQKYPDKVRRDSDDRQLGIDVAAADLHGVMQVLRDSGMDLLVDLTAVDWPEEFQVVYHLMSSADCSALRVRVRLSKDAPRVASVIDVWAAAGVQERETWDLMGIVFEGHPDLRRILCPDDFEGHPLRKDYSLGRKPRV